MIRQAPLTWAQTALGKQTITFCGRPVSIPLLKFCTSPVASGALRRWAAGPAGEGCRWRAGGGGRQAWRLANAAWCTWPTIAATDIQEAVVARFATSWHQKSMEA